MNIREYIASGILEAYVMGEVTAAERREVEEYRAKYPEIREELDSIEKSQEAFLISTGMTPSPGLRSRILENLPERDAPVRQLSQASAFPWRMIAAASLVLAVLAGGLAVVFYQNWQEARTRLSDLTAQNQQIAENYNRVRSDLQDIQSDLTILANPDFQRIALARPEGGTEAQVFWNQESQEVYLRSLSLARLAEDQQYQLWALIDGQPVDAGVFDSGGDGILKMKNIARADAFAITIEPRGGSENPTLSELQVIGELL